MASPAMAAQRQTCSHSHLGRDAKPQEVPMNWSYIAPILLLIYSNVFMTFASYGQLKYPAVAL
jgi:hypothetical protein